ncbi:MAG: hypothetical protein L6R39_002138 [Caloplaca ligustica]|nr:MAG: hypothetical protein L6R39_002138 [Caloplaca ligustica]
MEMLRALHDQHPAIHPALLQRAGKSNGHTARHDIILGAVDAESRHLVLASADLSNGANSLDLLRGDRTRARQAVHEDIQAVAVFEEAQDEFGARVPARDLAKQEAASASRYAGTFGEVDLRVSGTGRRGSDPLI